VTGRVVVVGGGIGGLATAALLARGGAQVTLLERHDRVGGRTGTLELDGFRFDTGPSWYFMPEVFEHFFALLGERVEDHLDLVRLDPAYRLFPEPDPVIRSIIGHRLAREAKVAGALAVASGPATIDDLLPGVYADVEPQRLPIARGSLWAHLRKLADDGRAGTDGYDDMDGGRWWATSPAGAP